MQPTGLGNAADMDKLDMSGLVKRAALGERDWYYLENRIRTQIHELMNPYLIKIDQAKDTVREMRDQVNNSRATIEDLALGQLRLTRYDEYFQDAQKRLMNSDINMKLLEKRFIEDMSVMA